MRTKKELGKSSLGPEEDPGLLRVGGLAHYDVCVVFPGGCESIAKGSVSLVIRRCGVLVDRTNIAECHKTNVPTGAQTRLGGKPRLLECEGKAKQTKRLLSAVTA